jgi:hypothetical protein
MNKNTVDQDNAPKGIKMAPSKVAGDWINRLIADHARVETAPAVERVVAVKEVKAKSETDVTDAVEYVAPVKGVAGKKATFALSDSVLDAMASENNVTLRGAYPNIGMKRMAVSNSLRAAAKKRGGLYTLQADGVFGWTDAPEDFDCEITHTPQGVKIAKETAVEAA